MNPASSVFEAELVELKKPSARRKAHVASPMELVVRRREDGIEIIRTPAELETPEILLATVNNDLLSMTEEEFMAEWKMPDTI